MRASRGRFIVLVGPDGVGKTSVAVELIRITGGVYFHFRPPLRGQWTVPEPGEIRGGTAQGGGSAIGSVLRLGRNLIRFWAGYLTSVRPALSAGVTVVADRWAYGYLAKPAGLRFHASPRLAGLVVGWFPRPDLVAALVAAPELIVARKPELSLEQARADLEAWSTLPLRQLVQFDATGSPAEIAAGILAEASRR